MGSSYWDDSAYDKKEKARKANNEDAFKYDADIKSGKRAAKVNQRLDPMGVTRESRDSAAHPESLAIMVAIDVTGSMSGTPRIFQKNLKSLMGILTKNGYVKDPQIMFSAVGDATSDTTPLQVGQFESGIEMDEDLARLYLEGGGGGTMSESYQLPMYFAARHTVIDCFDKRNDKGYLFIIGDETSYPEVSVAEAKEILGDKLKKPVPIEDVAREVSEKYEVFYIIPRQTAYWNNRFVRDSWAKLLGEDRVLRLSDPALLSEFIASVVGMVEGKATLDDAKKIAGNDTDFIDELAKVLKLAKKANKKTNEDKVGADKGEGWLI